MVVFAVQQPASAQQFSFIHHSIEDGLAQSQVRDITQDQRGYLWFATMGGVSRFDGTRYTNFSTEHGLIDNQVNCIFPASGHNLWFGCAGGMSVFNGTRFSSYPLPEKIRSHMVADIAETNAGDFLIATNGAGLLVFSPQTGKYSTISTFSSDEQVRKILKTASGDFLVGARSGLYLISEESGWQQREVLLDRISISDIALSKNNQIWLATFGDGAFLLSDDSTLNITEQQGLQNNFIRELAVSSSGHLWVASRSGLNKVTPDGKPVFNTNIGLNYDNIKTLFIDREENLWIGTDGKGVFRFTGESFVTYSKRDGLISEIIMAIQRGPDGGIWLGSYDNGVCKILNDTTLTFTTEEGLKHNTVWSLHHDQKGRIWFGTNLGISLYENGEFTNYTGASVDRYFERVTAIHEDQAGRIWFGIVDGIAVFENDRFLRQDELPAFPGSRVRGIFETEDGDLWFGAENGLVRKTESGYRIYEIPQTFKNSVVYNGLQDHHGRIWVGTKSGLFTVENDSLRHIIFSDGFGSNTINFLEQGKNRHLYIGTNNGLFVLDIETFHATGNVRAKHFTDQEGLASLECNQNAVFLDQQEQLWFGTTEGVIRFDSETDVFDTEKHNPLVIINNLRLILEEKNWSDFADSIDVHTGLPIGLELQPQNNHLTFDFVGLYYSNPGKVVYQYMLEGIDENWSPETPTNFTTYASLPHGEYTFKVRAHIEGDTPSDNYASFGFTILPPFYLTWWFIGLSAVALILLVWLLIHVLLKNEERKRRTQQLVYTSRMLALEQQTLNSSMNRHFIFNALNSIQYYINRQDKLSANKYLSSFARLIRKNLDSSQSNFTTLEEEIERIELYLSLENMRFPDKFTYSITVDPSVDAHTVQIPTMLFQPYLENSIWHGILPMKEPGAIKVTVNRQNEDVVIKIEDNGIGIDESKKLRQESNNQHIPQGMQINQNRIELFRKMTDQNFKIEGPYDKRNTSPASRGTVVAITFPLKSEVQNGLNA